jgi:hypothetical protein
MLELAVLMIGIFIALMLLYYQSIPVESFEDFHLSGCPVGYTTLHESNGDTRCCKGEIVANQCMSTDQCMLNGKASPTVPDCVSRLLEEYKEKATQCPSSLPSYFEDNVKKTKGCTNGPLHETLTAPKDKAQPICTFYPTSELNQTMLDSCSNQKDKDSFPCFGTNCRKELVQTVPNTPVLISVGFTDGSGVHRVAYTRASMERSLDATHPGWREKGMDVSKNIIVAEVAKAFYVDKTMSKEDIQL